MLRSLRSQLAVASAVLILIISALSGLIIVLQMDAHDRETLDGKLQGRLSRELDDIPKTLERSSENSPRDPRLDTGGVFGGPWSGSETFFRLIDGTEVIALKGELPLEQPPLPTADGFSTVTIDDEPWRSLAGTDPATGIRVEVLQSLAPIQQRFESNVLLVSLVTLVAVAIATLGAWLIARFVLQPVARLSHGAATIRADHPAEFRLPAVTTPREVAQLSDTLNDMLERLQRSMLATRRFTADAGHELRTPLASLGTYLEILERNPALDPARRAELLGSAGAEHQRIVRLLEGLQTLARGDAASLPAKDAVDLVDLVSDAVARARRRHPSLELTLHSTVLDSEGTIDGWPEGLRLAVDNLLTNAATHGGARGHVRVDLSCTDDTLRIVVSDDGPGIAADQRERATERFVRGPGAVGEGSGLGLALVQQQAALHGGTLTLGESALGGLAATITLPAGGG
ncbi:sensor histidine kinase [Microbacterium sp. No. 7]|uniref:sensor histidine kinase n=1 Tax=Microbacterium sp. No. 7 TaxID=1714373 RepID=UPI0006ED2A95|nr:HAMP domain-containing sensor histidine kinase [Microbacterium sp. No. 7]ALJ22176.1 hypothetical protein AOA12_20735 [Microbacterium sp. No. 7]